MTDTGGFDSQMPQPRRGFTTEHNFEPPRSSPPPPPPVRSNDAVDYAGFLPRVGAALIDGVLMLVLMAPFVIWLAVGWEKESGPCRASSALVCETATSGSIAMLVACLAAFLIVLVLYEVIMIGRSGQTLGKMATGIKVIDNRTGAPLSYGSSFGRWFMKVVVNQICFLGFLWPLWDDENQGLHDKVVGSWVVRA